jgi:hypothetical protein
MCIFDTSTSLREKMSNSSPSYTFLLLAKMSGFALALPALFAAIAFCAASLLFTAFSRSLSLAQTGKEKVGVV